ncbi:MAG: dTDP-4-dehydrorhamnose reductase [Kiritimatiellia bacterium]|jgi:dTDP-4-dehydrorhamnose reductase
MQKILLTGASGFLGTAISNVFSDDYDLIRHTHTRGGDGHVAADLRDADACRQLVEEVQPDVLIHPAAYRDPDFCELNPEESKRLNVDSVEHLRAALRPDALLIYVSSDYVFSGENPPYREVDPAGAVNLYGRQKMAAEQLAAQHPRHLILRMPVLIGQDPVDTPGFITKMAQAIRDKTPRAIDDVLMRFPTWTDDVARAIRFLINADQQGVFHCSSEVGATTYALHQMLAQHLGEDIQHLTPSSEVVVRPAPRPRDAQLSPAKLNALGFPGFHSLAEVLESLHI